MWTQGGIFRPTLNDENGSFFILSKDISRYAFVGACIFHPNTRDLHQTI